MLVPKLRFKREDGTEYPEWKEFPMSEIFTEIIEKNRADLPVLSILQGQGTVYRDNSDRNIMYDKSNTKNYKAMKKGDFIIHLRTFEGGLECATLDGISSPAYKILRTDKLVPEAYKAYFRSRQFINGRLAIAVTGVRDGKNIEMSTFWQILVPVPHLEEQQKIADFLSTVDEVIAQSEAEVQNLEQQKKAAMQKIFSQEVRFKREDGTEYPEWEEKELDSVCIMIRNGYTYTADGDRTKKYKVSRIETISSGQINMEKVGSVDAINEQYKMQKGDILVSHINSIQYLGNSAIYLSDTPLYHGMNLLCIRCNDKNILPLYLIQFMRTSEYFKCINIRAKRAVNQCSIPVNDFRQIPTPFPCLEEQRKIADFLSAYDEAISYAKQELDKWKELKKGLLQQMFV